MDRGFVVLRHTARLCGAPPFLSKRNGDTTPPFSGPGNGSAAGRIRKSLTSFDATIADTRDGGLPVPNASKIFSGSGNRTVQIGFRLSKTPALQAQGYTT